MRRPPSAASEHSFRNRLQFLVRELGITSMPNYRIFHNAREFVSAQRIPEEESGHAGELRNMVLAKIRAQRITGMTTPVYSLKPVYSPQEDHYLVFLHRGAAYAGASEAAHVAYNHAMRSQGFGVPACVSEAFDILDGLRRAKGERRKAMLEAIEENAERFDRLHPQTPFWEGAHVRGAAIANAVLKRGFKSKENIGKILFILSRRKILSLGSREGLSESEILKRNVEAERLAAEKAIEFIKKLGRVEKNSRGHVDRLVERKKRTLSQ